MTLALYEANMDPMLRFLADALRFYMEEGGEIDINLNLVDYDLWNDGGTLALFHNINFPTSPIGLNPGPWWDDGLTIAYRFERIGNCLRLFVNFLLHVVSVFAQFHAFIGQLTDVYRAIHLFAFCIENAITTQTNFCHIAFFQVHHIFGDLQ